jgi:hypothetical protein
MPFQGLTTVAKNAYTEENWHIMSSAYEIAGLPPPTLYPR